MLKARRLLAAGLVALVMPMAGVAHARPAPESFRMVLGQVTPPPIGYYEFCRREPADCLLATGSGAAPQVSDMAPGSPGPTMLRPNYWSFAFRAASVQRRFDDLGPVPSAGSPAADLGRRPLFSLRKTFWRLSFHSEAAPLQGADGRIILTKRVWSQLNKVNRMVNRRVISVSDRENYQSADVWALPLSAGNRRGDCEDYVMEKRHQLLAAGYPMRLLSVALVRTRWGDTHALLLVETDQGTLALDSFSAWINPWWKLDYQWIMRQSPDDPSLWVSVRGEGWTDGEQPTPG